MSDDTSGSGGGCCLVILVLAALPAIVVSMMIQRWRGLTGDEVVEQGLIWAAPVGLGMLIVVGLGAWLIRR